MTNQNAGECDGCGGVVLIDLIIRGTRADGSDWEFALCRDCAAKLPPINDPKDSEIDQTFGEYTREELIDLLDRSR